MSPRVVDASPTVICRQRRSSPYMPGPHNLIGSMAPKACHRKIISGPTAPSTLRESLTGHFRLRDIESISQPPAPYRPMDYSEVSPCRDRKRRDMPAAWLTDHSTLRDILPCPSPSVVHILHDLIENSPCRQSTKLARRSSIHLFMATGTGDLLQYVTVRLSYLRRSSDALGKLKKVSCSSRSNDIVVPFIAK
jgi:hypothetical protein